MVWSVKFLQSLIKDNENISCVNKKLIDVKEFSSLLSPQ